MKASKFTVGRDRSRADVVPEGVHLDTVSRCHLAVHADWAAGIFRIEDLKSANGTFVWIGGKWEQVPKARVEFGTRLRLGSLETTMAALAPRVGEQREPAAAVPPPLPRRDIEPTPAPAPLPAPAGRISRNPLTGEIIIE